MTTGICILGAPKGKQKPFIVMLTESKETYYENLPPKEDALKIFKAGTALLSTGGGAPDNYREKLASEVSKVLTIQQKINLAHKINKENLREYDELITVISQFDDLGNPTIAFCRKSQNKSEGVLDLRMVNKGKGEIAAFSFGEVDHNLISTMNNALSNEPISIGNSIKKATEYIKKVAENNPETCNQKIQVQRKVYRG